MDSGRLAAIRVGWLSVASAVLGGATEGLVCPMSGDDLTVEWIPAPSGDRGEFRLWCSQCGAENYVLVSGDEVD